MLSIEPPPFWLRPRGVLSRCAVASDNGSRTASASQKYLALLVSIRIGSQLCVHRSVTLSGIGAGLVQAITSRTHQPLACSVSASRNGIRHLFFAFSVP